jgi:hypothetical protein
MARRRATNRQTARGGVCAAGPCSILCWLSGRARAALFLTSRVRAAGGPRAYFDLQIELVLILQNGFRHLSCRRSFHHLRGGVPPYHFIHHTFEVATHDWLPAGFKRTRIFRPARFKLILVNSGGDALRAIPSQRDADPEGCDVTVDDIAGHAGELQRYAVAEHVIGGKAGVGQIARAVAVTRRCIHPV